MISERQFASSHTSVWRSITPLGDGYWKTENLQLTRFASAIYGETAVRMRAIVNDTAFRAFCDLSSTIRPIDQERVGQSVDSSVAAARDFVARFSESHQTNEIAFDDDCRREAINLATRQLMFFQPVREVKIRPSFSGCGLISACEGDVMYGDCLYEVKAGDRAFRITDLRQLLIYSALAFACDKLSFESVGLFNPRTGLAWERRLDEVCLAISGTRANDTLPALVEEFMAASVSR